MTDESAIVLITDDNPTIELTKKDEGAFTGIKDFADYTGSTNGGVFRRTFIIDTSDGRRACLCGYTDVVTTVPTV